jgi:predicted DNA-binding protein
MSSNRITVRMPDALTKRLKKVCASKGKTESHVIREALERHLGQSCDERSAYDMADEAELIGCLRRAPKYLSTHPGYFAGFGKE